MTTPKYMIAHDGAAVQAVRIIAAVALSKELIQSSDCPTANQKIARARRALERIRNVGKDRSEKAGWRIDDMIDEAEEAMQFLALPTKI